MINYHADLVNALKGVLPTYYETSLHSGIATPCISYMEFDNIDDEIGNTIGYSRIIYQVKVWGNDIGAIQKYAVQVDKVLRELGFTRTSANELHDPESTMIQKVMLYEALVLEEYSKEEE